MTNRKSWNAIKKELRNANTKELMQKLQELEKDRDRLEVALHMAGRTDKRYTYSAISANHISFVGNLHAIKKRIACVKTYLNVKHGVRV